MKYRIKELIAAKRAELGRKIILQEIADKTGVSQPMLSKLGSDNPPNITAKRLEALCKYFGVSLCELAVMEPNDQLVSGMKVSPIAKSGISTLSTETPYIEKRLQNLESQNSQILGVLQRMEGYLKKITEGTEQEGNFGNLQPEFATAVTPPNPVGDIVSIGKLQRGGTLVIGHCWPMDELPHPVEAEVGIAANFYSLIFTQLVGMTAESPASTLAYDWKQSGSSWIFNLYEGVKFHNGDELTAHDVKLTYEELMRRKPNSPIKVVEALDDYTFKLVLKHECPPESLPTPNILPKGKFSPVEPIGSGPFQVVQFNSNYWMLKAHKDYFRDKPFLSEVHIRRYNDFPELEDALIRGDVHLAIGIARREKGFVTKYEAGSLRCELVFMMDDEICQNENFRKAIYYGLDRAAIAETVGMNEPKFATGAYDYILGERTPIAIKPDFQKARQLLDRIPNLNPHQFRLAFLSEVPMTRNIANVIIAQLRELGIQAELGMPGQARVMLFDTRTPELEHKIWHSSGRSNVGGYSNPEADKLLKRLENTNFSKEEYERLQAMIRADCPTVPLFYLEEPVTYVKNLRALENRMVLLRCLYEINTWYFEAEEAIEQLAIEAIA